MDDMRPRPEPHQVGRQVRPRVWLLLSAGFPRRSPLRGPQWCDLLLHRTAEPAPAGRWWWIRRRLWRRPAPRWRQLGRWRRTGWLLVRDRLSVITDLVLTSTDL